jgi:hypothetical protein
METKENITERVKTFEDACKVLEFVFRVFFY